MEYLFFFVDIKLDYKSRQNAISSLQNRQEI